MLVRRVLSALAIISPATLFFFTPDVAWAGLDACGKIDVKADARCELQTSGGCTAQCEPVHLQVACAAKLQAQCDGQCSVAASADCTGSCSADCEGKCTANPGTFDCKGNCTGSCNADCDAQCSGSASGGTASGSCKAQCSANCSAKCDVECKGTPPSATCEGKCSASCKGSCEAKVNAKCQIDCQGKLEASCETELSGGCKAKCSEPKGALFCDGNYVDTGNNLDNCVAALNALLNIKVSGSASSSCDGGTCQAQAEGSVSACSTSPGNTNANAPLLPGALMLGMGGLAFVRSRRRRS